MTGKLLVTILSTLLVLSLAGCARAPATPAQPASPTAIDPVKQAEAEATAIMQQALATALVLQAKAQATQLIVEAGSAPATAEPTQALILAVEPTATIPGSPEAQTTPAEAAGTALPAMQAQGAVELLGVGFAAEGGFIIVNFRAPPAVVQGWWQGLVSVTDEASGMIYNEIPVMPVIGPLIGRPVEAGQIGYVMLTHNPPSLRYGSLVTVVLGEYKFEHVKIQ